MRERRKGKADKKASNNSKRNQQYIPVQDREATRDIECASSAGIYIYLFIFIYFFFSTNCCTIAPSAPTTELPDVGSKRARDDFSMSNSENVAPCSNTRNSLRTPASEPLSATASAVSSSTPGPNTRSLFTEFPTSEDDDDDSYDDDTIMRNLDPKDGDSDHVKRLKLEFLNLVSNKGALYELCMVIEDFQAKARDSEHVQRFKLEFCQLVSNEGANYIKVPTTSTYCIILILILLLPATIYY